MLQPNTDDFIKTLSIEDTLLLKSEHTVFELFNNQELIIDYQEGSDLNLIIQNDIIIFEIEIKLNIEEDTHNKLLLSSSCKLAAIYSYDKNNLSDENIKEFATTFFRYAAVTHIMAFCREYFYSILIKSGYPRIILPLINLLDKDAQEHASTHLNEKLNKVKEKE